ncbi:MAG: hypothetical protein ACE5J7_03950 [Candidatus Aenigmatarchaeota archaeon]
MTAELKKITLNDLNGSDDSVHMLSEAVKDMIDKEMTEYELDDGRMIYKREDGFYVTKK